MSRISWQHQTVAYIQKQKPNEIIQKLGHYIIAHKNVHYKNKNPTKKL